MDKYPSDITRAQFSIIKPILESSRKRTSPRTVDLYDVFCGILYLLKSGCQWRMLPKDYPKWRTCHYYFSVWSEKKEGDSDSTLDKVLKKIVTENRILDGRKKKTSCLIIDAQRVKNTDTAKNKGYDAGKKISGIKRHIAVDTNGFPHAIGVTTAEVTDRNGALEILKKNAVNLSKVLNILADSGYTGKKFSCAVQDILGCSVEIAKRSELHTFAVIPKRWVVERSFAWLEKCRRLWKNCERTLNASAQMMTLSFAALLLKRL